MKLKIQFLTYHRSEEKKEGRKEGSQAETGTGLNYNSSVYNNFIVYFRNENNKFYLIFFV